LKGEPTEEEKERVKELKRQEELRKFHKNFSNFFRGYTPAEGVDPRQHREFSKKYLDTLEESYKI